MSIAISELLHSARPSFGRLALPRVRSLRAFAHAAENQLLGFILIATMLAPLAEIVLRRFSIAVVGPGALLPGLVLLLSLAGAAVAARDGRLLAFASLSRLGSARLQRRARIVAGGFAASVSALLSRAAGDWVAMTRQWGGELAYGIPEWWLQAALPAAFALISTRLALAAADRWQGRLGAAVLAVALVAMTSLGPESRPVLLIPGAFMIVIAILSGAPIFSVLGGATLLLFWIEQSPLASIPLDYYQMASRPMLAAIPLFTLAGYFLANRGASGRLLAVFDAAVGHLRGGTAVLTALVCAFFSAFTGASGVTILALGGLLLPVLQRARYRDRDALGILTASGSLGLLFPPSLPVILYVVIATTAGVSLTIEDLFIGGLLPGLLLVGLVALFGVWRQPTSHAPPRFDGRRLARALWAAKWELALPPFILIAIFGGLATLVEAAALAALYALIIEAFIHRDLGNGKAIGRVISECGLLVGGVLLILGIAMGLTNYLVDMQIPQLALEWVQQTIDSPIAFLIALNALLLVVGAIMDVYAAIVVVAPLILPMATAYGINPVHLGIIFLANLELGYLTPPVGLNLFLAATRFKRPIGHIVRAILPLLALLLIGVLLVTYLPWLSTWHL